MIAQLKYQNSHTSIQSDSEEDFDGVIEEGSLSVTIGQSTEKLNKLVEELGTALSLAKSVEPLRPSFLDQLLEVECMSEFQFLIEQEGRDVHFSNSKSRVEGSA